MTDAAPAETTTAPCPSLLPPPGFDLPVSSAKIAQGRVSQPRATKAKEATKHTGTLDVRSCGSCRTCVPNDLAISREEQAKAEKVAAELAKLRKQAFKANGSHEIAQEEIDRVERGFPDIDARIAALKAQHRCLRWEGYASMAISQAFDAMIRRHLPAARELERRKLTKGARFEADLAARAAKIGDCRRGQEEDDEPYVYPNAYIYA